MTHALEWRALPFGIMCSGRSFFHWHRWVLGGVRHVAGSAKTVETRSHPLSLFCASFIACMLTWMPVFGDDDNDGYDAGYGDHDSRHDAELVQMMMSVEPYWFYRTPLKIWSMSGRRRWPQSRNHYQPSSMSSSSSLDVLSFLLLLLFPFLLFFSFFFLLSSPPLFLWFLATPLLHMICLPNHQVAKVGRSSSRFHVVILITFTAVLVGVAKIRGCWL